MKQGGDHGANSGFTIVETLIVLAVTGLLFVTAALAISGRQNRTQFQTAINNVKQQFEQIINETASGYFPSSGNFKCMPHSGTLPTLTNTHTAQGTNSGCIFMGKVLQFGVSGTDPQQFVAYPLAGNRLDGSSNEVTTLYGATGAYPTAVAHGSHINSGLFDLSTSYTLQNGLKVVRMWRDSTAYSASNATGTVGFLPSLAGYSSDGKLLSGSQNLSLYTVSTGTNINMTTPTVVDYIDGFGGAQLQSTSRISVCFQSGGTTQSGLVSIDGTSSLTVSLQVFGNTTCS